MSTHLLVYANYLSRLPFKVPLKILLNSIKISVAIRKIMENGKILKTQQLGLSDS